MKDRSAGIFDRVERIITFFVAILMGLLALLVSWQVFSRYVLKNSPYWIEEFSVTAMMWIGLLGASACVWTGSHMSLELFIKRLPDKWKAAAEILIDLIICAFALFLLTQGWVLTASTMDSLMATIPLPLGLTYLPLPAAGAFMILFAAARAAKKLAVIRAKKGGHGA